MKVFAHFFLGLPFISQWSTDLQPTHGKFPVDCYLLQFLSPLPPYIINNCLHFTSCVSSLSVSLAFGFQGQQISSYTLTGFFFQCVSNSVPASSSSHLLICWNLFSLHNFCISDSFKLSVLYSVQLLVNEYLLI